MLLARTLDTDRDKTAPHRAALLGLLLFLWVLAAVVILAGIGIAFSNGGALDATRHVLDTLLPTDPASWSAFGA